MGQAVDGHATARTVMMLDRLREVFGSDAEVARATCVDPSQLSRWRRGQEPSESAWDRLVDMFAVVQRLEGLYAARRIRAWIEGPNAHLDGRTPLYLIRHGEAGAVLSAIQALKAGSFA